MDCAYLSVDRVNAIRENSNYLISYELNFSVWHRPLSFCMYTIPCDYQLCSSVSQKTLGARLGSSLADQTPNREVLGSIPNGDTVFYPLARRINSLGDWLKPR